MAVPIARKPPRLADQSGQALIEVIVASVVLALVALAVLSGIDGAQSSTAREKARAVASTLAERDQERLRTMSASAMTAYGTVSTPFTVGGATYTVVSKVEWVRDDNGGTVSCANNAKEADYLHLTSTVTSSVVGTRIPAVKIDSIVAPDITYTSQHGTLAVKVINNAGQPLAGVMVAPSGADSVTATVTNTQGCALFQNIEAGDYTVTLNSLGMVDRSNSNPATSPVTVPAGQLKTLEMSYDIAGTINATVQTYKIGSSTASAANTIGSQALRVSAVNSAVLELLTNTPARTDPATDKATFQLTNLYPFSSAYSTFTGACKYSSPTFVTANANYYATYPGSVGLTSGGPAQPVNIRQPPLNLRMTKDRNSSSPPADGMLVYVTPVKDTDDSCVEPTITLHTFTSGGQKGYVGRGYESDGATLDAGVPFGQYDFCFQRGDGSGSNPYRYTKYPDDYGGTSYDNTAPLGQPSVAAFDASSTSTSKWHTTNLGAGAGKCLVTP